MHLWFGLTVDITSPALNGKYFQFPSRAEISIFLEAQCILGGAKGDSGLPSGLGLPAAKIALDFHRLHKFYVFCGSPSVPPMPRGAGRIWVSAPGLRGSVTAMAGVRLALRSTGPACSALTTAVQFILSYFPRTSGKQTMHHFKDAFMKQLGCIKLFLLWCVALPQHRQTLMHNSRDWRKHPSCIPSLELMPGKYISKFFGLAAINLNVIHSFHSEEITVVMPTFASSSEWS